jgi:hypothetical protein
MPKIEVFTTDGVVSGAVPAPLVLNDGRDEADPIDVERATWYPVAGGSPERHPRMHLEPDELLVVCEETQELPIHASWHDVELEVGPYRITGSLPTLPGFDPGRALTRPGGPFVLIRDVRLELSGHPEGGRVQRAHALVSRYAVEQVAADLDLGFYFPGAKFLSPAGQPLG